MIFEIAGCSEEKSALKLDPQENRKQEKSKQGNGIIDLLYP
jgi:hypothetical protein